MTHRFLRFRQAAAGTTHRFLGVRGARFLGSARGPTRADGREGWLARRPPLVAVPDAPQTASRGTMAVWQVGSIDGSGYRGEGRRAWERRDRARRDGCG